MANGEVDCQKVTDPAAASVATREDPDKESAPAGEEDQREKPADPQLGCHL